ncbi:MAG: hypothetical protein ACOX52_09910 [Verrucomicrobiota bacterium]
MGIECDERLQCELCVVDIGLSSAVWIAPAGQLLGTDEIENIGGSRTEKPRGAGGRFTAR